MRAIRKFFAIFGFGAMAAATIFVALNYQFIFAGDQMLPYVERKGELTLEDTIVSTRSWGPMDYVSHPRISAILLKHKIKR